LRHASGVRQNQTSRGDKVFQVAYWALSQDNTCPVTTTLMYGNERARAARQLFPAACGRYTSLSARWSGGGDVTARARRIRCRPTLIPKLHKFLTDTVFLREGMRWAGHVARVGEGRKVYKVLVGKPEGKRPLGRPRRRREDGVGMDLREIGLGGVDWIRLSHYRDRWRAVVSAVMTLRVLAPRS
jgi:hypothetical protein